jgi:hypothetical protein
MERAQGNPTEATTLAYLAGIIDGEGHVGIAKLKICGKRRQDFYQARMVVKMTDRQAIDLLYATFGGYVYWRGSRTSNSQPTYNWEINGRKRVAVILEQLLPHLRVKEILAELVIEFCRTFVNCQAGHKGVNPSKNRVTQREQTRREDFYLRAKKLNARGARASTERRDAERRSDSQDLRETVRGEAEEPFPPNLNYQRLH